MSVQVKRYLNDHGWIRTELTILQAINERIKELDFKDTKVRVTNVDSQGSDANIVIQVIGEISNQGQPHKRFVQTFVLAEQTNGYFVLNDIFRYLAEEPRGRRRAAARACCACQWYPRAHYHRTDRNS